LSIVCNFTKGTVSLESVRTFFHEFGHVMHQICGRPEIQDHSGFDVEGDFIEAPSQMLENWCYSAESLKIMSEHTETKEPLSQDLIVKLKDMKNCLAGYFYKRQLKFGIFDLRAHMLDHIEDSNKLLYDVHKLVMNEDTKYKYNKMASFNHMLNGYDAGYYGYILSETFAANMYYKVFKGDELNPINGMRYRKLLLEPGSTKDGMELLEQFLGEKPNSDYFLQDKGL